MSPLAIAGLVPFSSVDWPGHLTATVFCQGCPWSCTYCQNTAIIDPRTPGLVPWSEVMELLGRRHGLLDGVVFSGGEALRQHEVVAAMSEVREAGFEAALHTAGPYPTRLDQCLEHLSWVGLDIKALPEDYGPLVGADAGAKAWQSLRILLESGLDYEVRTTVHPGSPAETRFEELAGGLAAAGVTTFALQEARTTGTPAEFDALARRWDRPAWRDRFAQMSELAEGMFDRVQIRAA